MSTELATPEAPAAPIVATPETAAPAAAPVVPAPAEPVSLSVEDRLELSPSQRASLLFGPQPTVPPSPVAPVEPAVAAPAAPVEVSPVTPAEPAAATPEAVTPTPSAEDDDTVPGITKNFRLHTDIPEQSAFIKAYKAALAVNPHVNPADVARLVGLDKAPGASAEIPGIGIVEPESDHPPADIAAALEEIAALEARLDGAFSGDELTKPEQSALIKELAAKNRELSKLELRHELAAERQAEAAQSQAATTRQGEMQAVETEYPSLADPDSELSLELDRQFFGITANPQHPDFQKVNGPGFPAYLTKKAADAVMARFIKKNPGTTEAQALDAVKGKQPAAAAPVSPAKVVPPTKQQQTQPVPRTVLVTAPGGQAAPAPAQLSIEQIRERASSDPNFRKAALGFTAERVVA